MRPSKLRKVLKERYALNQTLTNLNQSSSVAVDSIYNKELQVWRNRGGIMMRDYSRHAIYHFSKRNNKPLTARP